MLRYAVVGDSGDIPPVFSFSLSALFRKLLFGLLPPSGVGVMSFVKLLSSSMSSRSVPCVARSVSSPNGCCSTYVPDAVVAKLAPVAALSSRAGSSEDVSSRQLLLSRVDPEGAVWPFVLAGAPPATPRPLGPPSPGDSVSAADAIAGVTLGGCSTSMPSVRKSDNRRRVGIISA